MKKASIIVIAILIFSLCVFSYYQWHHKMGILKEYNLTVPQTRTIIIDGKEIAVTVYQYSPVYKCPTHLLANKDDMDYSMPEDTKLALWSAIGRDRDWYVSLYDREGQRNLIEKDAKSNGTLLEEYNKGMPLLKGYYDEFMYKVECEINNKQYAIINMNTYIADEKMPGRTYAAFVKNGGIWLRTGDLKDHAIKKMVGLNIYDDFLRLTEKPVHSKLLLIVIIAIFALAGIICIASISKRKRV